MKKYIMVVMGLLVSTAAIAQETLSPQQEQPTASATSVRPIQQFDETTLRLLSMLEEGLKKEVCFDVLRIKKAIEERLQAGSLDAAQAAELSKKALISLRLSMRQNLEHQLEAIKHAFRETPALS